MYPDSSQETRLFRHAPSATEEILGVIRKGDSEGFIRRLCDDFNQKIINPVWHGRPFKWDIQKLKMIPEDLTLAEALALLTPDGDLGLAKLPR